MVLPCPEYLIVPLTRKSLTLSHGNCRFFQNFHTTLTETQAHGFLVIYLLDPAVGLEIFIRQIASHSC